MSWRALLLGLLLLILSGCGSSGGGGSGGQEPDPAFNLPADLSPFLVKKVCVDNPLQDPYICTNRRELLPGEWVYVSNIDMQGKQIRDALYLPDSSVVVIFDFEPFNKFTDIDGYDWLCKSALFFCIKATRDPKSKGVAWLRRENGGCTQLDTWILFPRFHSGNGMLSGFIIARLHGESWEAKGLPYPGLCTGTDTLALTRWSSQIVVFTPHAAFPTGKVMLAIVSEHYNSDSEETATQLEVFYCTYTYGCGTRWEFWVKQEKGESPISEETCNGTKRKGKWLMMDCRDASRTRINNPPFNAAAWLSHVPVP